MKSVQIRERLVSLKAQAEQAVAQVNILVGAVKECETFLAEIEKEESEAAACSSFEPFSAVK